MFHQFIRNLKANKKLLLVFSWTSISTVLKVITSFITNKVAALFLGPSGIAIMGQMNNLIVSFNALGTAATDTGITSLVAENADNSDNLKVIIHNIFKYCLIFSVVTGICLILFSDPLSLILFQDSGYRKYFVALGTFVFFGSAANLTVSIINGLRQFKDLIILNIISNVLVLIAVTASIFSFGLNGVLYALIFAQPACFFGVYYFMRKKFPFYNKNTLFKSQPITKSLVRKLTKFSVMGIISILLMPWISVIIRTIIIRNQNLEQAGYWDSITKIGSMYTMVITAGISFYYLPILSGLKEYSKIKAEIFNFLKLVMPALALAGILLYLFRSEVTLILYSPRFSVINEFYSVQILGELVKIVTWLFGMIFWAKARVFDFFLAQVVFAITYIGITFYYVGKLQVGSAVWAYLFANLFTLITTIVLLNIREGANLKHERLS